MLNFCLSGYNEFWGLFLKYCELLIFMQYFTLGVHCKILISEITGAVLEHFVDLDILVGIYAVHLEIDLKVKELKGILIVLCELLISL